MNAAKKAFLEKRLEKLEQDMREYRKIRDLIKALNKCEDDEVESLLDDAASYLTDVEGALNEACYALYRAIRM